MAEDVRDDSSHYEVSLTATQALAAFILLLGSLAAAFAFGLMMGRGGEDRVVVRREPPVINEGNSTPAGSRIVELGIPPGTSDKAGSHAETPAILEEPPPPTDSTVAEQFRSSPAPVPAPVSPAQVPSVMQGAVAPYYAQLISTSDVKAAEGLAARLIEKGYTSAYVQRTVSDRGTTYRVRVKFATEAEARAAVGALRTFTNGEVWITR